MFNKLKTKFYQKGLRNGIEAALDLLYSQDTELAKEAADTIGSIGKMWFTNKRGKAVDTINLYKLCEDEMDRLDEGKE